MSAIAHHRFSWPTHATPHLSPLGTHSRVTVDTLAKHEGEILVELVATAACRRGSWRWWCTWRTWPPIMASKQPLTNCAHGLLKGCFICSLASLCISGRHLTQRGMRRGGGSIADSTPCPPCPPCPTHTPKSCVCSLNIQLQASLHSRPLSHKGINPNMSSTYY